MLKVYLKTNYSYLIVIMNMYFNKRTFLFILLCVIAHMQLIHTDNTKASNPCSRTNTEYDSKLNLILELPDLPCQLSP